MARTTVPMINVGLPYYNNRGLKAGAPFNAEHEHVAMLEQTGLARRDIATKKPEPVARKILPPPPPPADVMDALRAEYQAKLGEVPDKRWGPGRLRAALDAVAATSSDETKE